MSKQMEVLQALYAQACQELGHLESNKQKIEKQIEQVRTRIDSLDRAAELLKTVLAEDLSGEGK